MESFYSSTFPLTRTSSLAKNIWTEKSYSYHRKTISIHVSSSVLSLCSEYLVRVWKPLPHTKSLTLLTYGIVNGNVFSINELPVLRNMLDLTLPTLQSFEKMPSMWTTMKLCMKAWYSFNYVTAKDRQIPVHRVPEYYTCNIFLLCWNYFPWQEAENVQSVRRNPKFNESLFKAQDKYFQQCANIERAIEKKHFINVEWKWLRQGATPIST